MNWRNCLFLALVLSGTAVPSSPAGAQVARDSVRRDSGGVSVSARGEPGNASVAVRYRAERRIPVTEEHLRTAFRDSRASALLTGARAARLQQDSALISYDARGYRRISLGLSASEFGRERLALRRETAVRVRWHRDAGAHIDVEGARQIAPVVGDPGTRDRDRPGRGSAANASGEGASAPNVAGEMQVPYFPGQEVLWVGSDMARLDAAESAIIHPFANGAEAYYKYARGDSARLTLPDGRVIRLVEMLVTPREPKWYLVVGSFWFDEANFRLVRAAYRMAVPMDIWEVDAQDDDGDDASFIIKALVSPLKGTVNAITVEYGLYEGRFWLPRLRTATGDAQASFLRVPFEMQQRFDYLSVNGGEPPPQIIVTPQLAFQDSLWTLDSLAARGDSAAGARAREMRDRMMAERERTEEERVELRRRAAQGDTAASRELRELESRRRISPCDTADHVTNVARRYNRSLRVMTTVTCNDSLLRNSPHLPPSIYSSSDELLGENDIEDLMTRLGLSRQADWGPQKPTVRYGVGEGLARYNRVEGFSPAIGLRMAVGRGFALDALARMGTADRELNGELSVARTNGRQTLRLTGYRRLAASNDWGTPLTFGTSVQALLFGRDEGFYYRARGVELGVAEAGNPRIEWRLYGERHRRADVEAEFSLAHALGGKDFRDNIIAEHGDLFGAAARLHHSLGEDPRGFRMLTDVRMENGMGEFHFGRGMFDVTFSHGVTERSSAALTLSAGSSIGDVPIQRHFMLGGTQSVRGQRAGAAFGDAFWMTRVELGLGGAGAKRVLFADVGWTGSREDWNRQSRALSGAGAGLSFLDGLFRVELARGIHPGKSWRLAMYMEGKL